MSEKKQQEYKTPMRTLTEEQRWEPRRVDKCCLRHTVAARKATRGITSFGMALDKVAGRGLHLQNAFFVLPSNVAFEALPQVFKERILDRMVLCIASPRLGDFFQGPRRPHGLRPQRAPEGPGAPACPGGPPPAIDPRA